MSENIKTAAIREGRTSLGIELGSTRIKAVLIDETNAPIASGDYEWENHLEDGIWTYPLDEVWAGVQGAYASLAADVKRQYGQTLKKIGSIGISAMMHGYLVFDSADALLVPFRTWRNTITGEASEALTEALQFHIPQRWSIAHLYQAVLNGEAHVKDIAHMTTLAGYVHWQLTGEKVLGVGEASGMFPIDRATGDFDERMLARTQELLDERGAQVRLAEILPRVLTAGAEAGRLTEAGAKLLDPTGTLESGSLFCPPEGDAGTGMVATNAVRVGTGNVSAGTSIFGMVVMERQLSKVYDAIDVVTTPDGAPVAMVHCNNCSSEINAWMELFGELLDAFGTQVDKGTLYTTLFSRAMQGEKDGGGLLAYNYLSGEHITELTEGRPLLVRTPEARLSLDNFMRVQLLTSMGALKKGMDILIRKEGVTVSNITGHGGLFKTKNVAQSILAGALNTPVSVMETAGEGGAWGMALLAGYRLHQGGRSLADYLDEAVFKTVKKYTLAPVSEDVEGFDRFMQIYENGLAVERAAVKVL
jgi:sugar (pentulose or hexulose) kinase